MYNEKLEHKKIGSLIGALYVMMIVVAIFALYIFINFIAYLANLPWLVYVMYALLVVGATLIIRKRLTDYSYGIAQGELIIDRVSSRNPKNLLSIPIRNILWFGQCADIPEKYAGTKLGKVTFLRANVSCAVIFKREKFTHGIMFTPSEEFIAQLNERMEKAKNKRKTENQGEESPKEDELHREKEHEQKQDEGRKSED